MTTIDPQKLTRVLVTDCGSTTTKAVLFEKTSSGWRQTFRGEAPTTVEAPVADVTIGALNAFSEVQELSNRKILPDQIVNSDTSPLLATNGEQGIDLYLSTSSAGGGLQMIVGGAVKQMSAESAQRAALGAGAIVLDVISADDRREDYEKVQRIRHLKPDIVLITGGVDGGSKQHAVEIAEILLSANPRPRFGETLKLPVIYAGNKDAYAEVEEILGKFMQIQQVPNVRPVLEEENLAPAREAIHEFFLSHVMSHAPGYAKLLNWTPQPIMPTPAAVGNMVLSLAQLRNLQVLAVDIGGATTDVFSVFKNQINQQPEFNRTVSANLGMSYSVANVLVEAGADNIARWLPYHIQKKDLHDRLRNKMIRPTTIPQTLEDLHLEQAICREALRLSLKHHRALAIGLGGAKVNRGIADIFMQTTSRQELVQMKNLDLVIGSGGVISHAPDRKAAALMCLDGFALEGVTQVVIDSIFMLPHLGVFAAIHPKAAEEILFKDCLVNVAHTVVPCFKSKVKDQVLAEVFLDEKLVGTVERGKLCLIENKELSKRKLKVVPTNNQIDVGMGLGEVYEREIELGLVGLILDGRNRPIEFSTDLEQRVINQQECFRALGIAF